MSTTTISLGSLVLVTGVNGYLGLHVADQLLLSGYKVRGTVRDAGKAQWTKEYFDTTYGVGNFEVVIIEEMGVEGVFDEVMKGCAGVCHVASDTTLGPDPQKVIPPVLKGLDSILKSAALRSSVKSFVYTSSSVAISHARPGVEFHIHPGLWNDEDIKHAWAPPPYDANRAWVVYAASKTQGEQAAWKFMEGQKPSFKFNTVNPNYLMGKLLHSKQGRSTGSFLLKIRDNDSETIAFMKAFDPQWMVDIVDVAKLHVIALTNLDVKNERLLAYAEKFDWNTWVRVMQKIANEKTKHLEPIENCPVDLSTVATERSVELLKGAGVDGFTPLDESMKELFYSPI